MELYLFRLRKFAFCQVNVTFGSRLDSRALFIQPKYAKLLNTQQIREVMGEPPATESLKGGSGASFPTPVGVSEKTVA